MAINYMAVPSERPGARRILSNVLIAVAAVCALYSIPLLLNDHDSSDGGGAHTTVFALTTGLAMAVTVAATLMKRIPFPEARGSAMTDEEILAGLEAQFEDEGPGPTI